jgi:molecular chaperone GrpE
MNDREGYEDREPQDSVENDPQEVEAIDLDDETDISVVDQVFREAEEAVERVASGHTRREAPPAPGPDEAGNEVEPWRTEVAEIKDRLARTLADFDNFRKRTEREQQEVRRYAAAAPLRDFVEVVDNLERALAASGSLEDLKAGVEMILRQMQDVLRQNGVREIPALDRPFDPSVHEAVMREEKSGVREPQVTAEFQKGYIFHERLLRPARVKVAVPGEPPVAAPQSGERDRSS